LRKEVRIPNPDNLSGRRLPRLLDIAGVAEHLAVSERHIRRLVAERRIPYVKWGHCCASTPTRSPTGSTRAADDPPDTLTPAGPAWGDR